MGFSLWKSPEEKIYVTFPFRAFGAGNEQRRYFDHLRPAQPGNGSAKALKDAIVAAYKAQAASNRPTS